MSAFVHSPIVHAALMGALGAAASDFHTFTTYKSWKDFGSFDIGVASYRWFLGAMTGAAAAAGWSAFQ
jgi:hypothetical protein